MLHLQWLKDPFLNDVVPALSEESLNQIAREHRTSIAVRHLRSRRMDLALSRDLRDDVLDPLRIRAAIGEEIPIDAAAVVQKHLDRDPFRGKTIADVKVRNVTF